ncbi:aldehyde dehydrogenase family protein [Rheinheimera soli]|uniref:Aldehyde dehydrogenase n=1 Tax=Rheinheimera soli TaxID=443616 RepID=A0ABU1W121_9GAMM|nr:aldehyde dehydrogenase family protein [Rheinheimera soli]MDR7121661.1 aldehyde dehydrogenase (NAD+) [Rheinheimera soli]
MYQELLSQQQEFFASGVTKSLSWRKQQLKQLQLLLTAHETELLQALQQDLAKPAFEALLSEINYLHSDIKHCLKKLNSWARPRRVSTGLRTFPSMAFVQPEPYGSVLIISAWNYPLQLALAPLVAVLSAGNCAVVKPSELAPATSAIMARLLPLYLDPQAVVVVEGGVPETTELLKLPFDHIMYTGNGQVGKIVLRAAAEHLTPVTLELGGKSPVYVDNSADLKLTAQRIAWGKWLNAGQTCIAPDYILAHKDICQALAEEIKAQLQQMYGADPKLSPDYGRMINTRHLQRVQAYLDGVAVYCGGVTDAGQLYFSPTLVLDPPLDSRLMTEEIFGPVLPILSINSFDAAVRFVQKRDKPLSAYLFSNNSTHQQQWVEQISSGSQCINDVLMFMAVSELPFGGVGPSGMGQYSGKAGFEQFSHLKSVLKRPLWPEPPVRFAPYAEWKRKVLGWLS